MGERTPVSHVQEAQAAVINLRLGQVFRPFEGLAEVPPLMDTTDGELRRVLVRQPFRFDGLRGAVVISTTGILVKRSKDQDLEPEPELGVDFDFASYHAISRGVRKAEKYYLEVMLDGKKYYIQIGHGDHMTREVIRELKDDFKRERKATLWNWGLSQLGEDGSARLGGIPVVVFVDIPYYDISKLAQLQAKFVKRKNPGD